MGRSSSGMRTALVAPAGPKTRPAPLDSAHQAALRLASSRDSPATSTRLRPDDFARYNALSAAESISSADVRVLEPVTPALIVTTVSGDAACGMRSPYTELRIRSAMI